MGTTWNSGNAADKNHADTAKLSSACKPAHKQVARIGRDAGLGWTRAQKFGAIACFVLLGILLAVSACSKEEPKSALIGVGAPAPGSGSAAQATAGITPAAAAATSEQTLSAPAKVKKARRKLAANVTYRDPNSGVSFVYPRKAALGSGASAQDDSANADDLPMNFVQSGGTAVATVALPRARYAGTDFAAARFQVNVNRTLSAEECPHFAFVDTSDADGEPIDAESVKVGLTDMKMTSEFAGNASKQLETRYYHNYENGACFEYVLGLSTSGFGQEGVQAVDRDLVFGQLEKILASVKIHPAAGDQVARKLDAPKPDVQKLGVQKQDPQKQATADADAAPDSER